MVQAWAGATVTGRTSAHPPGVVVMDGPALVVLLGVVTPLVTAVGVMFWCRFNRLADRFHEHEKGCVESRIEIKSALARIEQRLDDGSRRFERIEEG